MAVPTWEQEGAFIEDAELVDSPYETQAQAKAPRTTYYMAQQARSAHETEEKATGELFNDEEAGTRR